MSRLLFLLLLLIIIIVLGLIVAPKREPFAGTNSRKLFLYFEAKGLNIKDFGGFPTAIMNTEFFDTIVLIVPNDAQGTTQAVFEDITEKLKSTGTTLPIEYWLEPYFGVDGPLCALNIKECNGGSCPDGGDTAAGVVDSTAIVHALSQLKNGSFPGISKKYNISLAWSSSIQTAKNMYPTLAKNLTATQKIAVLSAGWDYSLGQAYTACSEKDAANGGCKSDVPHYYSGDCDFSENFWENIAADFSTSTAVRGVPMVCGAGNCQIDDIDERMNAQNIEKLLKSRPTGYTWQNFAIWYGTYNGTKSPCLNKNTVSTSDPPLEPTTPSLEPTASPLESPGPPLVPDAPLSPLKPTDPDSSNLCFHKADCAPWGICVDDRCVPNI